MTAGRACGPSGQAAADRFLVCTVSDPYWHSGRVPRGERREHGTAKAVTVGSRKVTDGTRAVTDSSTGATWELVGPMDGQARAHG